MKKRKRNTAKASVAMRLYVGLTELDLHALVAAPALGSTLHNMEKPAALAQLRIQHHNALEMARDSLQRSLADKVHALEEFLAIVSLPTRKQGAIADAARALLSRNLPWHAYNQIPASGFSSS